MIDRSASFLEVPTFDTKPEALKEKARQLMAAGDSILEKMGKLNSQDAHFKTTALVLDDLRHREAMVMSQIHLLQNTSPDEDLRKAAEEAEIEFQKWSVEKAYDAGVYQALTQAQVNMKKDGVSLQAFEAKLLTEELRDRRRLGLHLPLESQAKLKELQKKLAQTETEFSNAINSYEDEIWVKEERLKGLQPETIQTFLKNEKGERRITLQYPDYLPVMEFCQDAEIRRELLTKKHRSAPDNRARLQRMVELRHQIAELLGYSSWNHYVLEERMAKNPATVQNFLNDFETRLRPKAMQELQELKALKTISTPPSDEGFHLWDYSFYSTLRKRNDFSIDYQALKSLFPLSRVLSGLFRTIEELFDLTIVEQAKGSFSTWHDDVQLFLVFEGQHSQERNREKALGAFYLDAFPRSGKYGHAAAFSLIDGKVLSDGRYQRPVSAMVCNFPKEIPTLSHNDVETLFHEFGHILHGILTWAPYSKFSGTSVAWDFVEAPSQILENWAWDYSILKSIVGDDSSQAQLKLTPDLVERLNNAHKAGLGLFYLRQVSFAKSDLAIHGEKVPQDACKTMDHVLAETFLPTPPDTFFGAGFGHMTGYASGYYGYAWADVMAADMFSLFKNAGLMNQVLGRKLRTEIYESGSARDELDSLKAFLGRDLKNDAFFENMGLKAS